MRASSALALLSLSLLASCGGSVKDSPPRGSVSIPGDAVPRPEARSRYGNGPEYEVFGKRYTVMSSGTGYSERGVASWYGQKFHGRLTSNRETYDMYGMTAAHKTLPLPTYVRVRNLRNNRSIVVRVNDRGPFVNNRIIDLSYTAALKLDMIQDGTSLVEVTAITFDPPSGDHPVRQVAPPQPEPVRAAMPPPVEAVSVNSEQDQEPEPELEADKIYVQVGAFGTRANAERQTAAISDAHIANVFIHPDTRASPTLYRVRIGPIHDVIQYDVIVEELESIGIADPYLILENHASP